MDAYEQSSKYNGNKMIQSQSCYSSSGDTLGEQFEVLSHPIRRHILTTLVEINLCEEEELLLMDFTWDEIGEEIRLQHTHLPKLDGAGFIDWDRDSESITGGERLNEIMPLIKLMIAHENELPANWL